MQKSSLLRIAGVVVLLVVIGVCLLLLPINSYISEFLTWVQGLGVWGPVALAAAYVVACVFLLPGSLLTLGAGFAFGLFRGFLAVWVGSNVGAAAAFLVGRTLARGWVEKKVASNPKFRAIDQAIGEQGFKIVFLVRLSPVIPFNLLNYGLGLTRVSFRAYVLGTFLGMLPGTVMYVYLGSLGKNLAEMSAGREKTVEEQVLFFAGLLATVVVTVLITRVAKKALAATVPAARRED